MLKTSEPTEPTGQGQHLFDAIAKQAQEGLTIRKAVSLREDADTQLDQLAKARSADTGVDYYQAYADVTSEGVGKSLMEASMELSRIIANPTAAPEQAD